MRIDTKHYLLLTSCLSAALPYGAFANPQGGQVVAGSATITETGSVVDIHQSTQRAIIDWRSFDIAPNETTRFHQPSASSHTLNRVNSMSRSVIEGTIEANGNITIVNPNGVFFSRGSVVDVGGLTATTADTSNANFMAGKAQHDMASANTAAEIRNEGNITVKDAGLATLVAPSVVNDGVITAKLGKVQLASGDTFVMDLGGDGQLQVAVDQATLQRQLVQNSGRISADGGYVALTAAGARDVVDSLITNTGVIEAKSVGSKQGKVVLYAEGSNAVKDNIAANKGVKSGTSTIVHSGTIDVSGKNAGERGGSVEVLADQIVLSSGSLIDASGHTGATNTAAGLDVSAVRDGSAGGDIKIGGDYKGGGTTATAKKLFVAEGAVIKNDAISSGDAGRTIFWSDGATQFAGTVDATSVNGVGGFTEVSGKNALGFTGLVDLRSTTGLTGTLLLDPTDITISTAADTGTMLWDGTSFTDTAVASSNLNTTTLQNQLALSDVIVSTASAQGGAGNITVNNTVTWNSAFGLTLNADNDIIINSAITNSGTGGITLTAGGDGAGNIDINADVRNGFISTGQLNLTATGGNITIANANLRGGGGVTINSNVVYDGTNSARSIQAALGTITLNGTINATAASQLTLQAQDFAINQNITATGKTIAIGPGALNQSLGLAGAAGTGQLSTAELDRITAGTLNFFTSGTGDINVGAYTWAAAIGNLILNPAGTLNVLGAQTFNQNVTITAGDINLADTLTSAAANHLTFKTDYASLGLAGAAGTAQLSTAELDRISDSWGVLYFGNGNGGTSGVNEVNIGAYSNWRDGVLINPSNNVNITGAQLRSAGAVGGVNFNVHTTTATPYTIAIDGDIDMRGGAGGEIRLGRWGTSGTSINLGGNLYTSNGELRITAPTMLTGAAGTTRLLSSSSINILNGGADLGSINAVDKNLEIRANYLTASGTLSGTTGGILLSPYSSGAGATMTIGDGGGSLVNYSTAFIDSLKTGFAHYTFGRADTGNIINNIGTWDDPVTFLSAGNFNTGAAVTTAPDGFTVNVGNNITLDHAITTSNGALSLAAGGDGAGNIDINNGANINTGTSGGALTMTATGGQITIANANVTAGAITFNNNVLYDGSNVQRQIRAGNGTLTFNGTVDAMAPLQLWMRADDYAINQAISGKSLVFNALDGNDFGVAGAAGDTLIDVLELGRIQTADAHFAVAYGSLNVGAYNWSNAYSGNLTFYSHDGFVDIQGAQNFEQNVDFQLYGSDSDINIGAAITNVGAATNTVDFQTYLAGFGLAGGVGGIQITATELDRIADGWNEILIQADWDASNHIDLGTYSNWRDPLRVVANDDGTIAITGNQAGAAGSNANLTITASSATPVNIAANIDFLAAGGAVTLDGTGASSYTLGGNILGNGVTLNRGVTLSGAAGTTRTINAGTGTLTTSATGTITATDKNLEIIADALSITGTMSATSGGVLLSPYTTTHSIGVGDGGAHNVSYSTALVNNLKTAFAHYTFGRSTTGNITNYMGTWDDPVTFLSAGNFNTGAAITAATNSVNITAGNTITFDHAVSADSLFARTLSATGDITLNGILTVSGAGTALELVSGDDIINNHGAGVFNLTGGGRFLTWSDDPLEDTGEEHFSGVATKRYNRNYGDAVEPAGNIRNYSVAPTLTVRGDNPQYTYGDAAVAPTTYTVTGWHMAEDEAAHSFGGAATFATSYVQGNNAGTNYAVTNNGSTLSSGMNYQVGYAASPTLTVNKANLRVKAIDLAYTEGSGVPVVTFLYEPTDFKLGQNATTAGLIGAPVVSNINWNTVGAGTYAMQVGFGGLSSVNYSFSEFMPRGVLTVSAAPVPVPSSNTHLLPDSVRKVMDNAGILYTGSSPFATSGTNNAGSTNNGKQQHTERSNAGSATQNVNLYDVGDGQMVASMLGTISIDPIVMRAFGLTYDPNKITLQ